MTATYYEVAERPSLGGGRWIVTADDTADFQPANGALRPSLIAAHTLRDRPTWAQVTPGTEAPEASVES